MMRLMRRMRTLKGFGQSACHPATGAKAAGRTGEARGGLKGGAKRVNWSVLRVGGMGRLMLPRTMTVVCAASSWAMELGPIVAA